MAKVKELGEKALIEQIIEPLLRDIGDDCAIIDVGNKYIVVTIDKIPEKPLAFEIGIMNYYDMGYYLAVANLSDVASMGAQPFGLIAATIVPDDFEVDNFRKMIEGIFNACRDHNTKFIGGDTGSASAISLVASAVGIVDKDKILMRAGARIGDLLFTTGFVGLFSTALAYYLEAKPKGLLLTSNEESLLKNKLIKPKAKFEEAYLLNSSYCTSCMDISDGFTMSIYELIKANKIGFKLYEKNIPVHEITFKIADYLGVEPLKIALGAGADYELLGTVKSEKKKEIEDIFSSNEKNIYFLGKVVENQGFYIQRKDEINREIPKSGWQHFIGDAKKVVCEQWRNKI